MHDILRIQAPDGGVYTPRELGLVNESGWSVHEPIIPRLSAITSVRREASG